MAVRVEDHDLGFKKIIANLKSWDGKEVAVGLFGEGDDPETNLAYRGAIQEYGTKDGKIPSRPFTRQCFSKNLKTLKKVIGGAYGRMLDLKTRGPKALERIGEWYTGKVKEEITSGSFTPNAISTIAKKGSSKPLIDTAEMRNRVASKVRDFRRGS